MCFESAKIVFIGIVNFFCIQKRQTSEVMNFNNNDDDKISYEPFLEDVNSDISGNGNKRKQQQESSRISNPGPEFDNGSLHNQNTIGDKQLI